MIQPLWFVSRNLDASAKLYISLQIKVLNIFSLVVSRSLLERSYVVTNSIYHRRPGWWKVFLFSLVMSYHRLLWLISFSAVHLYDFLIFTVINSSLHGFIWNQLSNQLPVGLLVQLVVRCTGITEVMSSNPVRAWVFLRPYFPCCKVAFVFNYLLLTLCSVHS